MAGSLPKGGVGFLYFWVGWLSPHEDWLLHDGLDGGNFVWKEQSCGVVLPTRFLWHLWNGRNSRAFQDKFCSFDSFWALRSWWCTNYSYFVIIGFSWVHCLWKMSCLVCLDFQGHIDEWKSTWFHTITGGCGIHI